MGWLCGHSPRPGPASAEGEGRQRRRRRGLRVGRARSLRVCGGGGGRGGGGRGGGGRRPLERPPAPRFAVGREGKNERGRIISWLHGGVPHLHRDEHHLSPNRGAGRRSRRRLGGRRAGREAGTEGGSPTPPRRCRRRRNRSS